METTTSSSNNICFICGADATCLCFECVKYYCDSCFNIIHEKQLKSHKKENIDPYLEYDLKCPIHPKYSSNLFCTNDNGKYK